MTAHISIAQLDLLKKQVRTLRSMDHSEHPISVCDKACEVAEAIETLIAHAEEQEKDLERLVKAYFGNDLKEMSRCMREAKQTWSIPT